MNTLPATTIRPSLSEEAFAAPLALVREGAPLIMVLGGAGTGKTTFLHALRRHGGGRQAFLAPTGVAALQLGGQTIHSFFGLPPRLVDPDQVKPRSPKRNLMKKLERLVIDEVSMVRADVLDAVDRCLRIARSDPAPFGGVQVVLVGDFLQLPPVVPTAEREILGHLGYEGPFAFDARVLREVEVARLPFTQVYRQTDEEFVAHLADLRMGRQMERAVAAINAASFREHRPGRVPVVLAPTNARVDAYNRRGLEGLAEAGRIFEGKSEGEFDLATDRLPVPETLVLKVGARVMAVRNDPEKQWVNGSVGTIIGLAPDRAFVRLDGAGVVEIERTSWERIRYDWDEATGQIAAKVVGTYSQLPLVPAWAVTVHKAQGLTLDDARIDFDSGTFAAGQAYVALSRARSLEGLSLARPLRASDIRIDRRVAAFTTAFEAAGRIGTTEPR
ncbi:ATP-dependent exoDNAse (exonuclease V) alpha subunit [Angulomicrobium tetraedrale]|uniref:ATP-dependent exoDNAse (Exonuclease V) alpha subunit n=1 Tax=Ancylobacter tetraedralis TaxID=217068 RepID=A0A839YZD0_9HYPH|nr:DEAD/DEAH box helicase [Ancylobacter tetraedralis]MBB3769874.1 ATP-dependent exoDNAse (exonuclease V) alpha subunit [Ancylobacter tetraedralis]